MVHRQCSELLSEKTVEREPSTIYLFTFIIKLKAFNAIRVRETLLLYHNRLHPLNPIRAANSQLIFLQNSSKQFNLLFVHLLWVIVTSMDACSNFFNRICFLLLIVEEEQSPNSLLTSEGKYKKHSFACKQQYEDTRDKFVFSTRG